MADFRQLALEFVLSDDATTQSRVAAQAADLVRNTPRSANPVAKWVESIQTWMPGNEDTDQMEDGDDGGTGDVIARAKALQYLASTLELLGKDTLKADQIKLLIAFFCAMFTVDHKAGILPSAKALTTICKMKAFSPQSGNGIIESICAMGDDFRNQVAETRLAIYELLHLLAADPDVSSELQHRHGEASGFMLQMIQLCRLERDPKNIMQWFAILEILLTQYSPSAEVTQELFGTFSSYFPISLRTNKHPSGITASDLKLALRKCFSAHDRVAGLALPYLVQKLDQGDQASVDVKIDILQTIKECMQKYTHVQKSIVPHVDRVWTSLKYEVRNGEVDDTINATLDVIRTMTLRLEDAELRNFTLTVLRECTDDLGKPTYAGQAGKLLVCVASAKPGAFIMIVSPTVKHVKEHLRHTKSNDHRRHLLGLLNSILEVRSRFVCQGSTLGYEDMDGLKSTDPVLVGLYEDSFKPCLNLDGDKLSVEKAIQGMGLLVCQLSTVADGILLIPESTCEAITKVLTDIVVDASHQLADVALVAMQRASMAWPPAFAALVDRAVGDHGEAVEMRGSVDDLITVTSRLAYVGCLEVSKKRDHKFSHFIRLLIQFLRNQDRLLRSSDTPSRLWTVYPAAMQTTMRFFEEALKKGLESGGEGWEFPASVSRENWVEYVANRYPALPQIDEPEQVGDEAQHLPQNPVDPKSTSSGDTYGDFVLTCLYVTRQLYRRSTRVVTGSASNADAGPPRVVLSDELNKGGDNAATWRVQYLEFIAALATFSVGQLSQAQQSQFQLCEEVVTLFRGQDKLSQNGDSATNEGKEEQFKAAALQTLKPRSAYNTRDPISFPPETATYHRFPVVMSLGVLQPLHPSAVQPLFEDTAFGPEFIAARLLVDGHEWDPHLSYFLMLLANKYQVETVPQIASLLERQMAALAAGDKLLSVGDTPEGPVDVDIRMDIGMRIYAVVTGILKRYTGTALTDLFDLIQRAPSNTAEGHILARKFNILFRPHSCLAKEHNAIIKRPWAQKAYMQLVKPIIAQAWPKSQGQDSDLVCANYSIAVLSAVRHLPYAIYEADAADLIRMILVVLQTLPVSLDVETALRVLETIVTESTAVLEPFLKSVITACSAIVAGTSGSGDLSWMPDGHCPADKTGKVPARCRNLSLALLAQLPGKFEQRHLGPSAAQVKRLLAIACGDRVREVRATAVRARKVWWEME